MGNVNIGAVAEVFPRRVSVTSEMRVNHKLVAKEEEMRSIHTNFIVASGAPLFRLWWFDRLTTPSKTEGRNPGD